MSYLSCPWTRKLSRSLSAFNMVNCAVLGDTLRETHRINEMISIKSNCQSSNSHFSNLHPCLNFSKGHCIQKTHIKVGFTEIGHMTYFEVTTRRWYNHDPLCVNYRRCSWLGRTCDYKEDLHGELPLKVVVTLAEILQLKYKTATTGKKNSKEELKQS